MPTMTGRACWVPAYLLAHLTPVLASTGVWIIVCALQPLAIVIGPVLGIIAVVLRNRRWVIRLRYGVRPATDTERAMVLAALVSARSLRGRGQPRIWIGGHPDRISGLSERDLAIGVGVLDALTNGRLDPTTVAAGAGRALAVHRLGAPTSRALIAAYCLPWRCATRIGTGILDLTGLRPLWTVIWATRPVVIVIAIVQQVADGRWDVATAVVVFGVLTYTTPVFTRQLLATRG